MALCAAPIALLLLCNSTGLRAQCTNGTQPECKCTTAPVLCTVDELDNYAFSMSSFQHPADAPSPLCPPPEGTGTVSNNPTWFAFVAWCTELTLAVHVSNCMPGMNGSNGVQIAIYSDCTGNQSAIECNTAPSDCNTNDKELMMDNLVIGETYYFLIDGCSGAYCDVVIDVVGVCGEEMISPWTDDVAGPVDICAGDSENHFVESLHGATDYHWYIDGTLIIEGHGLTSLNHVWNTAGTFELCVDASNDPCIPESDPPLPNCITINVYDADAGMIMATPTPVCPDEIVTITASGYESGPDYEQYIVIADASGTIVEVVAGDATTFTHDMCASFTAYSYNYHDTGNTDPPQVGDPISSIACTDGCCDTDMAPFSFEDNINPVLLNPPANITVACFDQLPVMGNLNWTDNCDGSGSVPGMQTGSADACNGGSLTRTWMYTDGCGNTATYSQSITVSPTPPPTFNTMPANITVDCNTIPSSAPDLTVSNNGSGQCAIMATVTPQMNGMADECGGAFSFVWQFTDQCGRMISHTQTVTVTPIPAPVFAAVPQNVTVACGVLPVVTDLAYTNNGTGNCLISGMVTPVTNGNYNACGGTVRYQWDFTDQCGRAISASQEITVNPAPQSQFVNPPADITVSCESAPSSFPTLSHTNNETGLCMIAGTVPAVVQSNVTSCGGTITAMWRFTDACNRVTEHTQTVTVDPAPAPAWVNPPADITVDCDMLPAQVPDLSYTNGVTGPCALTGTVPGVLASLDACAGLAVYQWQFDDGCGNVLQYQQNVTINPLPPVMFLNPPADITLNCSDMPPAMPSLSYTNGIMGPCAITGMVAGEESGSHNLCGGELARRWTFVDPCGNSTIVTQIITFLPGPPMAWVNPPPADVTISCDEVPADPPLLLLYNGQPMGQCAQIINVPAEVTGAYDNCGGELTYYWEWTEFCGTTFTYMQHVTVDPAPPPVINTDTLPPFISISCNAIASIPLELPYSNGLTGPCAVEGMAQAVVTGEVNPCGGPVTFEWSVDDGCGNIVSFTRTFQGMPAPAPNWVDPPANDTLPCFEEHEDPDVLQITNNLQGNWNGPCEINEWIAPVVSFADDTWTHTWTYIGCNGEVFEYTQLVYDFPEPEIEVVPDNAVVCYNDVFDLTSINVVELNGQPVTITYHTASPPTQGNQIQSPEWTAAIDKEFVILATNAAGCTDEAVFELFVLPLPNAGDDGEQAVCSTEGAIDFTDYLSFDADFGGYWVDVDGAGVDVDNPSNVSFTFVDPGTYHFQYIVQINECPADTSVLTIILTTGPEYTIDSVYCENSNTTYTVVFTGANLNATTNFGDVVITPGGLIIDNIPIDEQLHFDIWDTDAFCVVSAVVNPPNCDCPSVPPAISPGNKTVCFGAPIPALAVTVPAGTIAHWYDAASGGTLLLSDASMYTPMVMAVGSYTFYVETESIEFPGCVSNTRTPVTLTIQQLPVVNNIEVDFCDTLETGMLSVDLTVFKPQINSNLANTLTFHASAADAATGNNPVAMPYTALLGSNILYARIVNVNGCAGVAEVKVDLNELPPFTAVTVPETCLGSADGAIQLLGLDPTHPWTQYFNNISWGNVYVFEDLAAGTYPIGVLNSVTLCVKWDTVVVEPGGEIVFNMPNLVCNDQGTDTDPGDDTYSISVSVNTTGGGTVYELFANGISQGIFMYGQTVSFSWPADGQQVQLIAVGTAAGCADTIVTAPLTPCSSNCDITIDAQDQVCDDNGTPLDPTDDFYTIILNTSAVNGSASNTYHVLINGTIEHTFMYGISQSFVLPVGALPTVQLQDAADPQCFVNVVLNPLTSCSNQCDIPVPDVQYTCEDNGTPDDATDDVYTIVFTVVVTNPGNSAMVNVFLDGMPETTVAEGSEVTLTVPADGGIHAIEIQDADDPACRATWNSIILTPCSSQCTLTLVDSGAVCDDNGTPQDPTDDFYQVFYHVTAIFGAGSGMYDVLLDGTLVGTGTYAVDETRTIPADGKTHSLLIRDQDDAMCTLTIDLGVLDHCSNDCALESAVTEVWCDNNGTNQTADDDVFYAVILVTGTNIPSGTWALDGTPVTGMLGVPDTLGPFLILDGPQNFLFTANGNACLSELITDPPAACSSCDQTIDAGPDQTLDCGTPTVTLTIVSSDPGMATWTDPAGGTSQGLTTDASIGGQYIATVVFPDGCVSMDTVIVTADPALPAVWGGPDKVLNCEVREVTLSAQVQVGMLPVTYEWTDAAGNVIGTNSDYTATAPGRYFIRIYDASVDCWSGKDAVDVTDISNMPSAVIYTDPGTILSCVILSVTLSHDNEVNVQYLWHTAGGQVLSDAQIELFVGGNVVLTAIDTITLCENSDSVTLDVLSEYPIIQIAPPVPLTCVAHTVTLSAASSIPGPGSGDYVWLTIDGDTIGTSATVDVTEAGRYILSLTDPANGCTASDTISVDDTSVLPELVEVDDVVLPCDVPGGALSATLVAPIAGTEFSWTTSGGQINGSASGAQINFTGGGIYIVQALVPSTQCVDRDTIVVTEVDELTAIALEATDASCASVADGTILLGMIEGGTPPYTIYVNGIETQPALVENLMPGTYHVQVEDMFGCMLETDVVIEAGEEVAIDLEAVVNIKEGETATLEAILNIPESEIGTLQWTPSVYLSCDTCRITEAEPRQDITYTVTVTDIYGCTGEASVMIRVADNTQIFIPNVITPGNGDQVNDYFTVYSNNPNTFIHSMRIFDRWGELVFERMDFPPNDNALGWDGSFKGKFMNPGVFVYKVELESRPGIVEILTGDVTIVR